MFFKFIFFNNCGRMVLRNHGINALPRRTARAFHGETELFVSMMPMSPRFNLTVAMKLFICLLV